MSKSLTTGSISKNLLRFSLPFLLSSFLQTFYGLADLFIAGQFNGSSTITAVSVGSQVMHMITVVIIGLTVGTSVSIGRAVGSKDTKIISGIILNSVVTFSFVAVVITFIMAIFTPQILSLLSTPKEAFSQTISYMRICLTGTLFITLYNILACIYRANGDSKTPMYFVAFSGILNIALDYLFMGPFALQAKGAALATVIAQILSALFLLIYAHKKHPFFKLGLKGAKIKASTIGSLFKIGFPIAAQDGFIQISFLIITMIANMRGVTIAAAVGIVEKLICFMFLVPSAMLSSVSTICAQNAGAQNHKRSNKTLLYAIICCVTSGLFFTLVCELWAEKIIYLFAKTDEQVVYYGSQYLRSYVTDCIVAGIHFCFSGYFCAYEKSYLSFVHNVSSIILIRIPGTYFASILYPETLLPMGMAAPLGSLFSAIICLVAYIVIVNKQKKL